MRIKNQSLLQLLSVVVQLGNFDISSRVFVEACQDKGLTVGESFFLHFETLFDYGFLAETKFAEQAVKDSGDKLDLTNCMNKAWDSQFSLTNEGQEFLGRSCREKMSINFG